MFQAHDEFDDFLAISPTQSLKESLEVIRSLRKHWSQVPKQDHENSDLKWRSQVGFRLSPVDQIIRTY